MRRSRKRPAIMPPPAPPPHLCCTPTCRWSLPTRSSSWSRLAKRRRAPCLRRRAMARLHGIRLRQFHRPGLELDIDRPDDLWLLAETAGASAAQQLVRELNVYDRMAYVGAD